MKNRHKVNCIFLLIIFFIALINWCDASEKVISTKKITATYLKSEIGDYNHAIFLSKSGKEIDFWCSAKMIDFLDLHKGKEMNITYKVKDVFIPEAKNMMRIEVIDNVKVGEIEFKDPIN